MLFIFHQLICLILQSCVEQFGNVFVTYNIACRQRVLLCGVFSVEIRHLWINHNQGLYVFLFSRPCWSMSLRGLRIIQRTYQANFWVICTNEVIYTFMHQTNIWGQCIKRCMDIKKFELSIMYLLRIIINQRQIQRIMIF